MGLHPAELAPGQRPKLARDLAVARGERHERAALDDEHLGVADRLRRERMLVTGLQAEHVTRHIECADLATAVGKDLVGSHRPAHHLVEVVRRLAFPVDFGIAGERHRGANELDIALERMAGRGRYGSGRWLSRSTADIWQHGSTSTFRRKVT